RSTIANGGRSGEPSAVWLTRCRQSPAWVAPYSACSRVNFPPYGLASWSTSAACENGMPWRYSLAACTASAFQSAPTWPTAQVEVEVVDVGADAARRFPVLAPAMVTATSTTAATTSPTPSATFLVVMG